MKRKLLILGTALTLLLALTACGRELVTKTTDSLRRESQSSAETNVSAPEPSTQPALEKEASAPAQEAQPSAAENASAPERTVTGTMLLGGKEITVYLDVSDTEINFWDSASGGTLLAVARYPETFARAADALKSCDYTDLDEDGSSELTAEFAFADGSTASLVWFYADGGLVYNEEFSALPGDTPTGDVG